ncbi:MAG: AtpZ/AtpI family protein [Hymenobacteraceae bacterium]|nr:AtpZ/AtpI family protein [Hymenobacteraceae bacterium]MDX5395487.1 AtpZ/AtpI family protein [Hymenobacteraceae bacterium]MDX5444289.1 AtpZ/AtpI family protein [Hymenobacteraceae bacterium]MDX5511539.1 AtpZ/AtpI family protein [Hymenobacteraceae bacterium]
MANDTPDKEPKNRQNEVKPYLKYSGLAFQMIAVMLVAALGGQKLDEYLNMKYPVFTTIFLIVAVVASIYLLIVSLTKNS